MWFGVACCERCVCVCGVLGVLLLLSCELAAAADQIRSDQFQRLNDSDHCSLSQQHNTQQTTNATEHTRHSMSSSILTDGCVLCVCCVGDCVFFCRCLCVRVLLCGAFYLLVVRGQSLQPRRRTVSSQQETRTNNKHTQHTPIVWGRVDIDGLCVLMRVLLLLFGSVRRARA